MKKTIILTFVLSVISFVWMIFYFLASTDIYHDYVSKTAVSRSCTDCTDNLPSWSNCKMEWHVLQADFFIRILFMLVIMVVLIKLMSIYNKKPAS